MPGSDEHLPNPAGVKLTYDDFVARAAVVLTAANVQGTPERVYCRAGAGFGKPVELSAEAGDSLVTPLLPGLVLPLTEVFRAP